MSNIFNINIIKNFIAWGGGAENKLQFIRALQ